MKTLSEIYVSFHKGRGGRFWNAGYVTFHGEWDFQELLQTCSDVLFEVKEIFDEDGNEVALPEDEWYVHDGGDNKLLEGREEMEAKTGCLDFDGEYSTDYTRTLNECGDKEWDALERAYNSNDKYLMSEDLKKAIEDYFGIEEDEED